jgi:hypothetical protein
VIPVAPGTRRTKINPVAPAAHRTKVNPVAPAVHRTKVNPVAPAGHRTKVNPVAPYTHRTKINPVVLLCCLCCWISCCWSGVAGLAASDGFGSERLKGLQKRRKTGNLCFGKGNLQEYTKAQPWINPKLM